MSLSAANVVAVLLAAGRSRRFGIADKLATELGGRPLIDHAAAALAALPWSRRLAVVSAHGVSPEGFEQVINHAPERGLGHSLALAAGATLATGPRPAALLVALGDMPLVPTSHFLALLEAFDPATGRIATRGPEARAMVPAIFAVAYLPRLATLAGDRGAQTLLARAPTIALDPALLLDIDSPDDLAAVAAIQGEGAKTSSRFPAS